MKILLFFLSFFIPSFFYSFFLFTSSTMSKTVSGGRWPMSRALLLSGHDRTQMWRAELLRNVYKGSSPCSGGASSASGLSRHSRAKPRSMPSTTAFSAAMMVLTISHTLCRSHCDRQKASSSPSTFPREGRKKKRKRKKKRGKETQEKF